MSSTCFRFSLLDGLHFDGVLVLTTPIQIFIDCDAKEFSEAFFNSVDEIQQSIAAEVRNLVGTGESETERIKTIFLDMHGKAVVKYNKLGGDFADHLHKEQKKALSQGVSLKECQLSRLIYVSGRAVGSLSNDKQGKVSSDELNEAFYWLSLANRFFGEYRNNNELYEYFNTPFKKKEQENFRRDTLLKLIFGMANHGYNCNHDNIKNRAVIISTKLQKLDIQVSDEDIIKFLRKAYKLESHWKEDNSNGGIVSETERITMLKLIIGMAIDKYDYDPSSNLNTATGNTNSISIKIRCHVFVDPNTIRNCLKAAKKIILSHQEQ